MNSVPGNDAGKVRVEAHGEDQHVEREQEPVVDELVVGRLWQALAKSIIIIATCIIPAIFKMFKNI
jgi:hypothetical protein